MKEYFSIIYKPERTFKELMQNDDGQHGRRTNIIILLTILLPMSFIMLYEVLFPLIPNSNSSPLSPRLAMYILPMVFGIIIYFIIFKYLIPFLIHTIGKHYSHKAGNIAQTRFIVAFSLIPILLISPLKTPYFIDYPVILATINILLVLAAISSMIILFVGTRLIYQVENKQNILIILPYIILMVLGYIIG
ncbi:MAG: YIP1 family protein [Flavobacteriales bacterium]|nr:YIP1 family protein [Flavobacteriales bacterium]